MNLSTTWRTKMTIFTVELGISKISLRQIIIKAESVAEAKQIIETDIVGYWEEADIIEEDDVDYSDLFDDIEIFEIEERFGK